MNRVTRVGAFFLVLSWAGAPLGLAATDSVAPMDPSANPATPTSVTGSGLSGSGEDVYDQLVSLSAGPYTPRSVVISNGTYNFPYGGGSTDSFVVEAGWAIRLYSGFYISENVAYSRFSGSVAPSLANSLPEDTSLSVNLIGIDSRLNYSLETFPVKWIIPFAEAGYQYTFYSQDGSSDMDSVQGGTGNVVAGAGLRLWVNRSASMRSDVVGVPRVLPMFLDLKWNRIFPNGGVLDLADSSFLAGVSVGL